MAYIQIPSICIPRVWHKFDRHYVEGIFCELFGPTATGDSCVTQTDMIPKKDRNTGENFWVVFVHFSPDMFSSDYLADFADRISKDEEVKIQYNPPWFWKVRKNKGTRKERARPGPRIMSARDEQEFMAKQKQILAERAATSSAEPKAVPDDTEEAHHSWYDTAQAELARPDISEIPAPPPLKRTAASLPP